MQNLRQLIDSSRSFLAKTCVGLLLMLWIAGCGVTPGSNTTPSATAPQGPQTYFAPFVVGTTNGGPNISLSHPQTYTIDDKANAFSQTTFVLQPPQQIYSQVINAGVLSIAQRGLRNLGITANYISSGAPRIYNPPETGSFAIELAGQTGGLVQLVGQPVAPLVAATQCPSQKTPQTYLFVTIPAGLSTAPLGVPSPTWNPVTDTAYGSVDISSNGSTVNFQNIRQFTLPLSSVPGTGLPSQPSSSSQTGLCGPTSFGQITNVPGQLIIPNPGNSNNELVAPQAKIGISADGGLLVEDNGAAEATRAPLPGTSPPLYYNNVLGAGTGAVGLAKPSNALDTGDVVGKQYLGFIYSSGTYSPVPPSPIGWSSHLASFGFPNVPSSCASIAPRTSTLIYGGDFTNDDPSTSPDGFGNCDLAIDFGAQDALTNGLYPQATVYMGANHFSAVAIAGQLNGKYAIFLIGVDSTQPWGIYLLQSN